MMLNLILIVGGIAFVLALTTQLINKLLINEKLVDENKEKMKEYQKKLKTLEPKSKEFNEMQDKVLDISMVNMKQQFKPMIFTFIPFIIIFYLISGMFAFSAIDVGSEVQVELKGNGIFEAECLGINETINSKFTTKAIVSGDCTANLGGREANLSLVGSKKPINLDLSNLKLMITPPKLVFFTLPFSLPFIGASIGWLGTFITFSLISSLILSKLLKGKYLRKWGEKEEKPKVEPKVEEPKEEPKPEPKKEEPKPEEKKEE